MSRIEPIDQHKTPALVDIFKAGEKIMGFVPNDGLIMAHRPDILRAFLGLVKTIYAPGAVSDGLKRLIGLIASTASGCQYCQAHAAFAASRQDEPKEKINAVWLFRESTLFTPAEKAALEVALKSAVSPNEVSDADFDDLKKYYTNQQIVEIVAVIGMYGFLNRWNATLQTPLEATPQQFFNQLKSTN